MKDDIIKTLTIKVTKTFYDLIEADRKKKGFSSISEYIRYYTRNAITKKGKPPQKR